MYVVWSDETVGVYKYKHITTSSCLNINSLKRKLKNKEMDQRKRKCIEDKHSVFTLYKW